MIQLLGSIESIIFFILAGIHFNWVLGGTWGFDKALPTNEKGKRVLNPKRFESLIVGLGLLAFSLFFLIKSTILLIKLPSWMLNYFGWVVAIIFLLRAIGEFKYVGFFKKIKNTQFAKADTNYFSPLCFLLASIAIIIQITSVQSH